MWREKYQKEIEDIIFYSHLGYERFLSSAAGGNVSCRCQDNVLITASGVSLGLVTEQDLILVDLNGNILYNSQDQKPSKETLFHLAIYQMRPDVNSVYHVHPPHATAYAVKEMEVPFVTSASRAKIGRAPLVAYAKPGTAQLSQLICNSLKEEPPSTRALLLAQHGIVTFCDCMQESFFMAELLEDTARIALLTLRI